MTRTQMWIRKSVYWIALIVSLICFSSGWMSLGNSYYQRKISSSVEEILDGSERISTSDFDDLADEMHYYGVDINPRKLIRRMIAVMRVFEDASVSPHDLDKFTRNVSALLRTLPEEALSELGLYFDSLSGAKTAMAIGAILFSILYIAYVLSAVWAVVGGFLNRKRSPLLLAIVTGIYFAAFIVICVRTRDKIERFIGGSFYYDLQSDFSIHLSAAAFISMAAIIFATVWWILLQKKCDESGQRLVSLIEDTGIGRRLRWRSGKAPGAAEDDSGSRNPQTNNFRNIHVRNPFATAVCPVCGAPVGRDAQFCQSCGAKVEHAEPERNAANNSGYCPNCHAPVAPGTKYCIKCGADLSAYSRSAAAAPQDRPAVRICPRCHRELEPDMEYCVYCGIKL